MLNKINKKSNVNVFGSVVFYNIAFNCVIQACK